MANANDSSPAKHEYVLTSSPEADETHCFGEVAIPPANVVRCFGKGSDGDGYKVSRQWVFRKGDLVFTLYDWKSTDLYDSQLWSPEELWRCNEEFDLHVGSKAPASQKDVEAFIAFLQQTTSSGKTHLHRSDGERDKEPQAEACANLVTGAAAMRRTSQQFYDALQRYLIDTPDSELPEELVEAMNELEAAWHKVDGTQSKYE
jgi:hypothetical protein